MAEALRILGYKVFDFEEQYWYQSEDWIKFLESGDTKILKEMFEDVDANTDVPASVFWEEFLKLFPDAKVIHMERKSEEDWVDSARGQTATFGKYKWMYFLSPSFRKLKNHLMMAGTCSVGALVRPSYPWQSMENWPAVQAVRYRQTNMRVRKVVPPERLLVFKHQEGWGPLCKFLGVAEPKVPYPHRNKGGSITDEIVATSYIFEPITRDLKISFSIIFILIAVCIYFLWNLYARMQML